MLKFVKVPEKSESFVGQAFRLAIWVALTTPLSMSSNRFSILANKLVTNLVLAELNGTKFPFKVMPLSSGDSMTVERYGPFL